jgi:hypothetical protein
VVVGWSTIRVAGLSEVSRKKENPKSADKQQEKIRVMIYEGLHAN